MSGRDWSLRLARAEDAAAMPAIRRAASTAVIDRLICSEPNDTFELPGFERLIRRGHCLVAHVGAAMAGTLLAEPFQRELHVWRLDVSAEFQRRGIGAGLVRAAQIDARNTGIKALTLTADRESTAPFFIRLGFEEVTALDAHIRLAGELAVEVDNGLSADRRCAMICFLD